MSTLPQEVAALLGERCFQQVSDGPVEAGAIRLFAAAMQDAFPGYWAEDPEAIVAPPAMLSAWNRPLMWNPAGSEGAPGLALHFMVKDKLGLPRAVVAETETEVAEPIRPGVRVMSEQILVEVAEPSSTRLGEGRYWTIRVEYRCADNGTLFGAETMRFFGYGAEEAA